MRQAGRYMPEYRAVRKQYSLIEICKKPEVAAQVTIEAAEILKVDAAIIFADLLLPLEVMGLPFHFSAGEGPKIEKPVRTAEDIADLRTDRAADLEVGVQALRRQTPRHRFLRCALHARQLHDRRWQLAQLSFH
jgi:uroporphyrinogen decarboxylase